VFARYVVELAAPAPEVERLLAADPHGWMPGLAEDAHHRGDVLLAEVGFGEAIRAKREVVVELGPAIRSASKTVFPIRWQASDHPGLFPALDADIEVMSVDSDRARLAMSARYEPPLGRVGRVIDRALLSRVAEATLKDFLDGVAGTVLRSPAPTPT
jgi:hypothetical protein